MYLGLIDGHLGELEALAVPLEERRADQAALSSGREQEVGVLAGEERRTGEGEEVHLHARAAFMGKALVAQIHAWLLSIPSLSWMYHLMS